MKQRFSGWLNVAVLIAALLFAACQQQPKHTITRGFYFWKTNVALNDYEAQRLRAAGCRRLFVRFFDVQSGPDGQPKPLAIARLQDAPRNFEITPVVFVVNDALKTLSTDHVDTLAARMAGLLARQCSDAGITPREIQIDCDWTATTKDRYFALLRGLKAQPFFQDKIVSATIRLHQVRYIQKTGTPPADRGLLMCYNMGDTRKSGAHNSILNVDVARQYLSGLKAYPLPLDVALPLFRWCLLFDGPRFVGIIRDATPEAAAACAAFERRNAYEFRCLRDTLWYGIALKRGMTVRAEQSDLSAVKDVATFVAKHLPPKPLSILLYHADSSTLQPFSDDALEEIYRACE